MTQPAPPRRPLKWTILLTCAGFLLIIALALLPFLAGQPREEGLPDIAKFIGRFHPVILHLPIGILMWVLAQEVLNLLPGRRGFGSSCIAAGFAAGSAVAAALLGFLLYYSMPEYDGELAERHLFGGIVFSCVMVATFLVKVWVDAAGGRGAVAYRLFLLVGAGVMVVASHDGASLTHGKGYLTEHAPEPLRKLLGLTGKKPAAGSPPARIGGDRLVYTDLIVPILEQKCYSCHNAEKQKGRYRMDEYELLLKGGKENQGIVPGNPAKSNLMVRVQLSEDDDKHMPPEGKKDLDGHELAVIAWWIGEGAPREAKLADLAVNDPISQAILKIEQERSAAAPVPKVELTESFRNTIDHLRREFPSALSYEFRDADTLVFSALGMRGRFGDEQLARLRPVLPSVVTLDLSHTSVSDEGVKVLAGAARLKSLRLAETGITDAALETLIRLPELESLNLYGTQVTNEGILKLSAIKGLGKLYLWKTRIDDNTLQDLREKLPGCEIVTGM